MKGLIIREPWISRILAGDKDWEMRSKPTQYRGRVGLIHKGSGTVVAVVELLDSLPALDPQRFRTTRYRHRIPPEKDAEALQAGWVCPWVLAGLRQLRKPVWAAQKPGAGTWVTFEESSKTQVEIAHASDTRSPTSSQ